MIKSNDNYETKVQNLKKFCKAQISIKIKYNFACSPSAYNSV